MSQDQMYADLLRERDHFRYLAVHRSKSIDELLAERSDLNSQIETHKRAFKEVVDKFRGCRKQHDALEAHVEQINEIVERMERKGELWEGHALVLVTDDSPTTSLARLVADHVDAALGHVEAMVEAGASIDEAVAAARRQAKGGAS